MSENQTPAAPPAEYVLTVVVVHERTRTTTAGSYVYRGKDRLDVLTQIAAAHSYDQVKRMPAYEWDAARLYASIMDLNGARDDHDYIAAIYYGEIQSWAP